MRERLDPRLRLVMLALVPGFVGHTIQLTAEDLPWEPSAWERYWWTPGWHLFLSPWVPITIAVALGLAALAMGRAAWIDAPAGPARSGWLDPRRTLGLVIVLYAAHYLTYPFRIRNHMSHVLASLGVVGLVWLVLWLGRPRSGEPGLSLRRMDALALDGLAVITCITYFFAGLHKLNVPFTDVRVDDAGASVSGSAAVDGLTTFWIYGDLGARPPEAVRLLAAWGTIAIELAAPLVAWRVRRARVAMIALLCAFHVPHVACMDVADYPMLASAFYPALFSRAEARLYAPWFRPRAANLAGAALGVAVQLWFMPFWGRLTVFGLFVLAWWGYALGALGAALWAERGNRDARRGRVATRERREVPP